MRIRLTPAALMAASLLSAAALPAHAGLFDDDIARKQISDLQKSTSQILIEQNRLMDQMNREVAELRGQIEVLVNQITLLEKRQKDLYMDIDTRLQPLEVSNPKIQSPSAGLTPKLIPDDTVTINAPDRVKTQPVIIPQTPPDIAANTQKPPVDAAAALRAYEAALDLFKAGNYKDAASAFDQFVLAYGGSEQASSAQFWLGNSYYALGDCVQVIITQQTLVAKWPESIRAPDAMLNIANCQAEIGDKTAAQKTFRDILTKYPGSKAAAVAKQQLK